MAKTYKEPRHARFYEWETSCPAYRSLNVYARSLLVEFKRKYNGQNNGGISMSFREAAALIGCSNKPVPLAFAQVMDRGFVKLTKPGKFGDRIFAGGPLRASTWTLTEYALDEPRVAGAPTKDFMRWQPPDDLVAHDRDLLKKHNRYAESVRAVRRERPRPAEAVRRERTCSTLTAYDETVSGAGDSTPRAYTYNIPDGGEDPVGSMPVEGRP